MKARRGIDRQPVNVVVWVDRHALRANGYNPNHVAPPELELLKLSLVADGWTQPIVARRDGEIVDGFHRWLVSAEPEVGVLTGGLVPVVYLPDDTPLAHQIASTIRHNRARGTHHVVKMADIVAELAGQGLKPDEIGERLGMEPEEVQRLYDRGNMLKRAAVEEFGTGWVPE